MLASSLLFSYTLGDLPFSRHFDPRTFQTEPRYVAFAANLARIPPTASVAAQNHLTPHLSHRRYIFDMEFEGPQHADYLALDDATFGRNTAAFRGQIETFVSRGYRVIATGDGLAILAR